MQHSKANVKRNWVLWPKSISTNLSFEMNFPFQWCHNERNGVSNYRCLDCLLNCLLMHRWKKTLKLRVTDLWEGNPPLTGGFPTQRASNAENASIWWRYQWRDILTCNRLLMLYLQGYASSVPRCQKNCFHIDWPYSHHHAHGCKMRTAYKQNKFPSVFLLQLFSTLRSKLQASSCGNN